MTKRIDELELVTEIREGDLIPLQTQEGTKSYNLNKITKNIETKVSTLEGEMSSSNIKISNLENKVASSESLIKNCESTGITMIRTKDTSIGTTYLLTKIPYTNKHGERNVIKKYIPDTNNPTKTGYPINKAIAKKAVFACNASSVFLDETRGMLIQGIQIQNGKAIPEEFTRVSEVPNYYTLGVKEDGTLKAYKNGSNNAKSLLDDGVVNSFAFTSPLIIDGEIRNDLFDISSNSTARHPRQVIGQTADKTVFVLTCEGRRPNEAGMTLEEAANILLRQGCTFAYNLDGGGSAQTIWNGSMMNIPVDFSEGYVERATPDILYVAKETPDEKQEELMRHNALNYKKNMDLINEVIPFKKEVEDKLNNMADTQKNPARVTDVHSITGSGFYWCLSNAENNPLNESCAILAIGVENAMSITLTGWRSGTRKYCYQDSNGWSEWKDN